MKIQSTIASRITFAAIGIFGVAGAALAGPPRWANAYGHYDRDNGRDYGEVRQGPVYARVLDVEPITRHVRVATPNRECWNETQEVYPPPHSSAGSTLLGGLIGGVIGHQIGHGDRSGQTVAGAVVGAAIGNQVGRQRAAERDANVVPVERSVERCSVSYHDEYEERIDGYRVTYAFDGREYTTRMPYDPGKRILIDVNVRPVVEGDN
jgi:uncharacterized protein YcfJ